MSIGKLREFKQLDQMSKVLMIDPPSGWKYGFPKPAPKDHHKEEVLTAWLLEQGYPKKDIKLALNYSRFWESDQERKSE